MAWAHVNGIRMYYESHGEGEAIVFAHGAGGNHLSWWQQVPYFSQRYRCITFDHRAFGLTADVPSGPGAEAYPDDLKALLDHLGVERAYLVAQSMGGTSCLGFTLACPERVAGLVMADTTGTIADAGIRERLRVFRGEGFTLQGRAYDPSLRDRRPEMAFLYDSIMALNPPRAGALLAPSDYDERFVGTAAKLAALDVPVLFVCGELDAIVSPDILRDAAAMVPGSMFEVVAGAGHSVYFEDAITFNGLVGEFIDKLVAG